jgi:hypothetical protein
VFDVSNNSTAEPDTAAVRTRIGGTPLASLTVRGDSVVGTRRIPLDTGFVAPRVRAGQRIRLAVRVSGTSPNVRIRISAAQSQSVDLCPHTTLTDVLTYFGRAAAPDTTHQQINAYARSKSPPGQASLCQLEDYQFVLQGSAPPPPGTAVVGGLPSSRAYFRFKLPPALVDSSTTVVRLSLELTRRPDSSFVKTSDSLTVTPRVVIAAPGVTDIGKAAGLLADPTTLTLRSIIANPFTPAVDTIPLVSGKGSIVVFWRAEGPLKVQRAITLVSSGEGLDPRRFIYYSPSAADPSVRPRLRITYIPRSGFGLP